jgi:hypothetical protein
MATETIALSAPDGTAFAFSASLGGTLYRLAFHFNARCEYWTLDLADASGEAIATGIRCVVDYDLLAHCSHASQPDGVLMLIDTAGTGTDPAYNDLGDRVKLVYTPNE